MKPLLTREQLEALRRLDGCLSAARIPEAAAKIAAVEHALIALCRSPEFSLQKLRAAIKRKI